MGCQQENSNYLGGFGLFFFSGAIGKVENKERTRKMREVAAVSNPEVCINFFPPFA